jgi:hypothetical protein
VARYNGGYGDDTGYALAVDSSDNVYVTGNSWNYDNPDLATVKYKQIYCTSPINGDLNNDCKVDLEDLAILVSHWLVCNYVIEEECL